MTGDVEILDRKTGAVAVRVARSSLELYLRENQHYEPVFSELPPALSQPGASFVTLTNRGQLRGCIGHTQARHPLAEDVAQNAVAAARDFRFAPVVVEELPNIRLEVTVLTPFQQLSYDNYEDLIARLRPGIDGVMFSQDIRRALLLPQVWHRLQDPNRFLEAIARKAGIDASDLHAQPPTIVIHTFQAQHFAEPGYREPGS